MKINTLWFLCFCSIVLLVGIHCSKRGTEPEFEPFSLQFNSTHVSMHGASDGAIDLIIRGGTRPYTFLWSNGETTEDIDSLSVGIFAVTVTDDLNETITDSVQLTQPYRLVRITEPETGDFDPHWSPEGDSIVFASWRTGRNEIYIIPAEGGSARQITFQDAYHPCWSPDGANIAFASNAVGGDDDIWVVPVSGGQPTRITTDANRDEYMDWSSDGSHILFDSNRGGNWNIWTIDVESGIPSQITNHPATDISPSCSPDGCTLTFMSDRSGSFDLYTIPGEGGIATRLTNGMGAFGYSDWSPDGTQIAFMSEYSGNTDLWIVSVTDGSLTQLTTHFAREGYPNWSPDGKKIAFTSNRDSDGDIWILYLESKYR